MSNKKKGPRCMVIGFKGGPERSEKEVLQKIFLSVRCNSHPQRGCLFKVEAVK
jgi:hypothetical protein